MEGNGRGSRTSVGSRLILPAELCLGEVEDERALEVGGRLNDLHWLS